MDRIWGTPWDDREQNHGDPAGAFVLDSRSVAIAALRGALAAKAGPLLVTGEAGVGKTWLWKRMRAEMPANWRWAGIDLSPATGPGDIDVLLGRALGLLRPDTPAGPRLEIAEFLEEASANGEDWVLVVDEAQSVAAAVLDELRILANRLGRADGFSGIILVGQTPLARRLATRTFSSLAIRIGAHVHLRPIDSAEAQLLVERGIPGVRCDRALLEQLHRDAGGNPKRLLMLARRHDIPVLPCEETAQEPSLPKDLIPGAATQAVWDRAMLGPEKPPLRMEEGLIEVGWEPTQPQGWSPPEPTQVPDATSTSASLPSLPPPSAELIDDHYAALQAWTEWTQNQGRCAAVDSPITPTPESETVTSREVELEASATTPRDDASYYGVWADRQQAFAPYSQLFSKLRQPRDKN